MRKKDGALDNLYILMDRVRVLGAIRYRLKANLRAGAVPFGIAAWQAGQKVYVSNLGSGTVTVISGVPSAHVERTVIVGTEPSGIAVDSGLQRVYVAVAGQDQLVVLRATDGQIIARVPVHPGPMAVAVDERTHRIYITNPSFGLSVVDGLTHTLVAVVPLSDNSDQNTVAVDSIRNRIYVTHPYRNTVSVLDGRTLRPVALLRDLHGPSALAVGTDRYALLVTSAAVNRLDVFGANLTLDRSIPVGDGPVALARDARRNIVYTVNATAGTLTPIAENGWKVMAAVPVGKQPLQAVVLEGGVDGQLLSLP